MGQVLGAIKSLLRVIFKSSSNHDSKVVTYFFPLAVTTI